MRVVDGDEAVAVCEGRARDYERSLPTRMHDPVVPLCRELAAAIRSLPTLSPWSSEEELGVAIAKLLLGAQVMIRDVDGPNRVGELTPACAANLGRGAARVALSRPMAGGTILDLPGGGRLRVWPDEPVAGVCPTCGCGETIIEIDEDGKVSGPVEPGTPMRER